ncbi:MAG: hypothetical protein HFJ28_03820 [Clostridia bacterium]|nr:hypothetical protein [Clostridia bacterium]
MKNKATKKQSFLAVKVKNNEPIRILYKKVGQAPEVKIISLWKLKKAIVRKKLDIIPYETLYIICHNKNKQKYLPINIVLDLSHVSGDFLLADIDKQAREFKGISQDDVIWYLRDLINKSFNNKKGCISPITGQRKCTNLPERSLDNSLNNINNFEERLLSILTSIELTLSNLLGRKNVKK